MIREKTNREFTSTGRPRIDSRFGSFSLYSLVCASLFLSLALPSYSQPSKKEIVLIVKDTPDQSRLQKGDGSYFGNLFYSDLTYLDDAGAVRQKRFKIPVDTVRIAVNRPFVEVGMQFKGMEEAYFLIKNGDSVDVTYRNGYPYLTSRTNINLTYYYNLITGIPNRTGRINFDVLTLIQDNLLLYKRLQENSNYPKLYPSIYKEYCSPFDLAKQQEKFIAALRDTIAANSSRLDSSFYSYYMYHAGWRERMWDAKLLRLGMQRALDIHTINDSDAEYLSYRRLLHEIFISPVICKNEWLVKDMQGSIYQYDKIFSHIVSLNLPPKSRNILLEFCAEGVVEDGSASQIKDLTTKFVEVTGNKRFVEELLSEAEVTFESGDKLSLADANGKVTNLVEVLNRNRGKVVYIDFWASWCAPCKVTLLNALQLREEFKGKDVVFMYLALNDKREPWKAAVAKHKVGYLAESYLITNSRSSDFLTKMRVKLIPRYLLFDKAGKLTHANAPGPEGKAIRNELKQLLKK